MVRINLRSRKSKFIAIGLGVVLVLIIAGMMLSAFMNKPTTKTEVGPVRYKQVSDDICPYIDLSALNDIAGKVESKERIDYEGSSLVGCRIVLDAKKQPDGQVKKGSYQVDVLMNSTGESESEIQTIGESWATTWKGDAKSRSEGENSPTTFGEIDGVKNGAFYTKTIFPGNGGAGIAYQEHVWAANVHFSVKMLSQLRGKNITGEEFRPYVRAIIEDSLKKLEK